MILDAAEEILIQEGAAHVLTKSAISMSMKLGACNQKMLIVESFRNLG